MTPSDSFKTISEPCQGQFKDKGSRFLAFAYPVTTEGTVKDHIKQLKKEHFDARHHVYAFRIGVQTPVYRCSDDGEPPNSSGPPVLGQIQSFGLTNILIVVVRYFGGTKLGVPGLINAYKLAAADALNNANIIDKFEQDTFTIQFGYLAMNEVMKVLKDENPGQSNQQFDNLCSIDITVRKTLTDQLKQKLTHINGVTII